MTALVLSALLAVALPGVASAGTTATAQRAVMLNAAQAAASSNAATSYALQQQASAQASSCFTDPAGDTRDVATDAVTARGEADVRSHCVDFGDTLSLRVTTATATDPLTDPNWQGATFVGWFLETSGDNQGDYLVEYSLDQAGDLTARVSDVRNPQNVTVTCTATAAYGESTHNVTGIAPSCFGGATSVRVNAGTFYDTGGASGGGPVYYDFAPNSGNFESAVSQGAGSNCPTPNPAPAPFEDRGDIAPVHRANVDCLYALGIALGTTRNGKRYFNPAVAVNRGQFTGFMFRTLEFAEVPSPERRARRFSDVADSHTFDEEIHRLAGAGIINGYAGNRFGPGDSIKRAQAATILLQAFEYATNRQLQPQNPGSHFRDTSGVHARNIDAAFENDLVNGVEAPTANQRGRYVPNASTTRQQMASVLVQYLNEL